MSVTLRHTVDVSGWSAELRERAARCQNTRPAFRQIGEDLLGVVDRNFRAEGQPPGSWAELSERTLLARARGRLGKRQIYKSAPSRTAQGRFSSGGSRKVLTAAAQRTIEGAKPLIWSGRLLRSIAYSAGNGLVDVGSNLVQAARQFFGYEGRPKTPARSPFGLTASDEARIERVLLDWICGSGA